MFQFFFRFKKKMKLFALILLILFHQQFSSVSNELETAHRLSANPAYQLFMLENYAKAIHIRNKQNEYSRLKERLNELNLFKSRAERTTRSSLKQGNHWHLRQG